MDRLRSFFPAVVVAVSLLLPATARGAEEAEQDRVGPRVALRGVAEAWSDPAISSVYRSGGLVGGAAVVVPLWKALGLDVEFGYKRLTPGDGEAEDQVLELLPLSLVPELTFAHTGTVEGFAGAGPSLTWFKERHAPQGKKGLGATTGGRLGLEARAGLRVNTGLMQPSLSGAQAVQAVYLELYGARRFQRPGAKGFDLGAWRGGMGIAAEF